MMSEQNMKPKEGSFLCIICKNRKHNEVHLLEGKVCREEKFVDKLIKLLTKKVYKELCDTIKSHNNKNHVCRSCFLIILNTYDSIIRLQTGITRSIEKRLIEKRLTPSKLQDQCGGQEDNLSFNPAETKRRKHNRAGCRKEELGKQQISSLRLVTVNNVYARIILKRTVFDSRDGSTQLRRNGNRHERSGSLLISSGHSHSTLSLVCPEMLKSDQNSYRIQNACSTSLDHRMNCHIETKHSLKSLLDAAKVLEDEEDNSGSLNPFTRLRHPGGIRAGPLSWKKQTGQHILPDNQDSFEDSRNLLLFTRQKNYGFKMSRMKPGPLSWKKRTNRSILPDNLDGLDKVLTKNLIVKTCSPVNLARLRNNNIYMCEEPMCGWIFISLFSLNNHIKYLHYSGRPHKCSIEGCEKAYAQESKLKQHLRTHSGEKPFVCSVCGKGFHQKCNLNQHMTSHSDKGQEKKYKCPRVGCQQAYQYAHTLKRHLLFHDGGELPFACTSPGCSKAYKSRYELKCHYRHHTGEKPYKCPEPGCGKAFRLPGQYTIHRRNHQGERPFKCTWAGCEAAYSSRGQLETHALSHQGKTFVCDLCGKAFTYKVALVLHRKKMHTEEREFVCQAEGCSKAFHFRFALLAHVTKVHNANPVDKQRMARGSRKMFLLYPCPIQGCGKEFAAKISTVKHVRLVHRLEEVKVEPKCRPNLLVCPVDGCESRFLTERKLRYHKMSSHNPFSLRCKKVHGRRFSCTFEGCKRVYETMTALREHVGRVHIVMPREKICFLCGAAFKHIQQLEIHRQALHSEDSVLNEQKAGIYSCKGEKCGMQFSTSEELKQHIHTHIENPPFRCHHPGCRQAFLTEKIFRTHEATHQVVKPFACFFPTCGQTFASQFLLLQHSIVHYGKYRCPVEGCEKTLTFLKSGRLHLFRHTGEKPYVCKVCGMAFAACSGLTRHARTHTGEKPFECKICFKRFSDKSVLTTHLRGHTGEMFICSICGHSFASLAGIKVHTRRHTGECPYVCQEEGCGKRFRDLRTLKSHSNKHSNVGQLCSQCGKVCRWGVKRHRCKMAANAATVLKSTVNCDQQPPQAQPQAQPEQQHQQPLQQPLHLQLQQHPQQQETLHQRQQPRSFLSEQPSQPLLPTTQSCYVSLQPQMGTQVPMVSLELHTNSVLSQQHQLPIVLQQQQQHNHYNHHHYQQQQQHSSTIPLAPQPQLHPLQPPQPSDSLSTIPQTIPPTLYVMSNVVMMPEQIQTGALSLAPDNSSPY